MDGQNYSIQLTEEQRPDGSSIWTAEHPDLPGCNASGADESEAVRNLDRARDAWMATAAHIGVSIPPGHDTDSVYQVKMSRPWPVDPHAASGFSTSDDLQFQQDLQFAGAR